MKKYIMKDTTTKYETSKVGTALNIFAIIGIVRGIIAGFVFAMNVPGEDGFVIQPPSQFGLCRFCPG